MKQLKYVVGFLLGIFRVIFYGIESLFLFLFELPEACHLFGLVCYHTDKFPWDVTEEEMLAAQEAHLEDCGYDE